MPRARTSHPISVTPEVYRWIKAKTGGEGQYHRFVDRIFNTAMAWDGNIPWPSQIMPRLPAGVTAVPLDNPAVMHNAIAHAVGEHQPVHMPNNRTVPADLYRAPILADTFLPIWTTDYDYTDTIPNGMTSTPEDARDMCYDLALGYLSQISFTELSQRNPGQAGFAKTIRAAFRRKMGY